MKYVPQLNLKTTEETHMEAENLRANKGLSQADYDAYYFNIVEEVNEFNDWCISEDSNWGIPIPFFTRQDSGEILIDPEIVSHVADIIRLHGSDAWFTFSVKDLLPARYHNIADKLQKGD